MNRPLKLHPALSQRLRFGSSTGATFPKMRNFRNFGKGARLLCFP